MSLLVVDPGVLTTVQDLGRPGWFQAGVGVSGAADQASFRLANRLVGNPAGAAALECLLGGLVVSPEQPVTVAVTGASVDVTVDGRPAGRNAVLALRAGQELRLTPATVGLRAYLAVRGGFDVPAVLGSRSYDTLARLGPPPLQAGAALPVGAPGPDFPCVDQAAVPRPAVAALDVTVYPGPHLDWFSGIDALTDRAWTIAPEADRVGAWLAGEPVERRDEEIPTEGMCLGAVEVTPSGQPVVFLADHPITGGYPLIGVVPRHDVWRLAQARPGQEVRLRSAGAARARSRRRAA